MPGIWDKAKVLGGLRMDTEYEPGSPFVVYGMASAGQLPDDIGIDSEKPAEKTVLLTCEATSDGDGGWQTVGDAKVVGTLSGPIAVMASQAGPDDFPVVVSWQTVATKTREKATVLDYLGPYEGGDLDEVPPEWNQYV